MSRGKRNGYSNKAPKRDSLAVITRAATVADIEQLTQLKRTVAHNAYRELLDSAASNKWLDKSCSQEFWRYRIGRKDYYVFVAEANGKIVGYTGYRRRGSRMDGSSVGMYVITPKQGVGKTLNKLRETHAKSLGCNRARTSCFRTNIPASNFVKGQGYEKTKAFRENTLNVMVDHYGKNL